MKSEFSDQLHHLIRPSALVSVGLTILTICQTAQAAKNDKLVGANSNNDLSHR